MTVIFERRQSASAIWARRVAIFSAVLLVVAVVGHRFALVPTIPFFNVLGVVAALAALALLLAGIGFFRLWQRGDRGGRASARATIIAAAVLVPFGMGVFRALTLPPLADVATDPENPPAFVHARSLRTAEMNPIRDIAPEQARLQVAAYPAVTGRRYTLTVDRMQEIAMAAIDNLGWRPAGPPQASGDATVTIEAVAPSLMFGFVSDVVIRIIDEGETSYVDVRSASRYLRHDLGGNAAKIERFFSEVDAEIEARETPVLRPSG